MNPNLDHNLEDQTMALTKKSKIVQEYLQQFGLKVDILEYSESTKTAQEAANAIGCEIGQIVKSLVFRNKEQGLLFLVSGKNNLDVEKVARELKIEIKKADADFVKKVTGFSIGGVPPVAHDTKMETYIDQDLLAYDEVWAAAGMPFSVFQLESRMLQPLTNGTVIAVN
jgi:prolyl-tRNA editing enzyme YbaK/EbsC (Cys-tRNA(Pro) deacylase)